MSSRKPPPAERLNQLVFGRWFTQAVATAVELGIPDRLEAGPRTADALAEELGCDPRGLYRLMRALTAIDVLTEDADRRFSLTPVSELLVSSHPGSWGDLAQWLGNPISAAPWGRLTDAVRQNSQTFATVYGEDFFDHLARNAELGALFKGATVAVASRWVAGLVQAIDTRQVRHVVDVGGGDGQLLAGILAAHPTVRATLFDAGHMIEAAQATLGPFEPRASIVRGDFFEEVPAGGDLYIIKAVLHDWDDARCATILRRCAARMTPTSRILVIEQVIGGPGKRDLGKMTDLEVLVMSPGGMERELGEFAALVSSAGLQLSAILPTSTPFTILELRRPETR